MSTENVHEDARNCNEQGPPGKHQHMHEYVHQRNGNVDHAFYLHVSVVFTVLINGNVDHAFHLHVSIMVSTRMYQ
jgi:hypothetical protein